MENKLPKINKKRILYFVPEFPRLSETFIEREISKLIEFENIDLKVFSMKRASGTMSYLAESATVYNKLTWNYAFLAGFYFLLRPLRVFAAAKIVFSAKDIGLVKKIYLLLKAIGYTKMFEKYEPNHIHAHFLSDPSTIALVASLILDVPFSISAHAKDVFVEGQLIAQKAKLAKFIAVCNGNAWREVVRIANTIGNSRNVHLLFHGFDEKKAYLNDSNDLQKPTRPMIFMGGTRFTEKKGIKYVIEASKMLKESGVEHQIDLVGPADDRGVFDEILSLVDDYGLKNNVVIHGDGKGTPIAQVLKMYKIADIFVFPAIETKSGDVDGVPTVVIEAAMAKLPIIATNVGSISDLINDTNGLIIEEKSAKSIFDAIVKLLNNDQLANDLGEKAYLKAKSMFDIDNNIKELEELFLS